MDLSRFRFQCNQRSSWGFTLMKASPRHRHGDGSSLRLRSERTLLPRFVAEAQLPVLLVRQNVCSEGGDWTLALLSRDEPMHCGWDNLH